MTTNAILEKRLRETRYRLFLQLLADRLTLCLAIGLSVGIACILIEPFLPATKKWLSLGWLLVGLGVLAFSIALISSLRRAPSRQAAALALDRRFQLRERVTSVVALTPTEAATPVGIAVLADAASAVEPLSVRTRFRIGLERRALLVPIQLAIMVMAIFFYKPLLSRLEAETRSSNTAETKNPSPEGIAALAKPNPPKPISPPPDRTNKSEDLQKLEGELKKLYADAAKPSETVKQESIAQKLEQIATVEERLRKFEQQQAEKFQRFQERMQKLAQLEPGESNKNGPAKELTYALSKGDLSKAKEEADLLKKKLKEHKLDAQDAEQLKKQLEDLQEKIERLSNNQQEEKKLQDLIDKAKKEGRYAESLERELKQLQEDTKQLAAMKKLADKLGDIKQALEKNDLEGVEKNLGDLAKQLEQAGEALGDLDDIEDHLQNLKEMKSQLVREMEAQEGNGQRSEGETIGNGRGQASGKRPENPDAKTDSEEARQRGRFDPKGRKTYAGAVNGPAYTKKTTLELVGEIKQAAQEAPNAIEVQRLSRSAREMVKEYFESLGEGR